MKNWSGNQAWSPVTIAKPSTEVEIVSVIQQAASSGTKVRCIGSGHSFTPLCVSDDIVLSLDNYQGLISVEKAANQVTVKAGTKLHLLNELLSDHGLAMENMGDINAQSIAGAISTGTHGTGLTFGNLSTQMIAARYVDGQGDIHSISAESDPEKFSALQVSLGTMGVITEITLQCVPSYTLELLIASENLYEVIDDLSTYNAHRNYEFYWFPHTDRVLSKVSNVTTDRAKKDGIADYFRENILENYAFLMMCKLNHLMPSRSQSLARFMASTITPFRKVSESHKVYSTPRLVRFNEMEYNVPLEAYADVKKEVTSWINKHHRDVIFPIENRFVKGDDIMMSPAQGRDSAYTAVHEYHKKPYRQYFKNIEDILKAHGGRPHWGKMHTLTATDIAERYPMFGRFSEIRQQADPHGIFLSPYMQTLFA